MKLNRRTFLGSVATAALTPSLYNAVDADDITVHKDFKGVQGFLQDFTDVNQDAKWEPYTDRKLRVGIAGRFAAEFGFQQHPNVELVAVTDLIPERCAWLSEVCQCEKTYPSLEEMLKDDSIEAVFFATDAPSHCDHVIKALKAGKHVASAVPAVFGSLEEADRLYEAVKESGLTYAMFETSSFHDDLHIAKQIYEAGLFGKMIYTEGEYYHYSYAPIDSYKGWRVGVPPQWYPTHSNAYYTCLTGGTFTSVSCVGIKSKIPQFTAEGNGYKNPFGTEIALFSTSEGGSARMAVSWASAGWGGEMGRMRGELGAMNNGAFQALNDDIAQKVAALGDLRKPCLPPGVPAGFHGGSHGYLGNDFVEAILKGRKPRVDVATALNTTVPGIVAHMSAFKDGEQMKIPQYAPL